MSRMLCAALLLFATAGGGLAQNGSLPEGQSPPAGQSLPAGPVPPAVVKALAPFHVIAEAIGTPRGRDIALPYLHGFMEEMKASGFVAQAPARSNQPDATVAPPAGN